MATHSIGEGKGSLSTSVPKPIEAYVVERAAQVGGRKKGWALRRIVEGWLQMGAPPLSREDARNAPLPVPDFTPSEPEVDSIFAFRLTDEERDQIVKRAAAHGFTPDDYLRALVEAESAHPFTLTLHEQTKQRVLRPVHADRSGFRPVKVDRDVQPVDTKKRRAVLGSK